jgi:hypothetical protein
MSAVRLDLDRIEDSTGRLTHSQRGAEIGGGRSRGETVVEAGPTILSRDGRAAPAAAHPKLRPPRTAQWPG